tara:strand:- start:7137 stop:8993 length:1857 start_codon:yes stop_codon:yes gene_type:complete
MDTFLDDPYYLGESTKTLYPKIRLDLKEALTAGRYREMVLTGGIGYGKTTFISFAIARMLYEISCLRSPQDSYGLSSGSEVVVALISKSLHVARQVMKTAVEDKIKISPYFNEHFKGKANRDVTHYPSNVMLVIGSCNSERVLGMNVVGGAMDEANFMTTKGQVIKGSAGIKKSIAQYDLAEKVYASIVRRIKSRFLMCANDLPGLMVLASSATTVNSFTDRKIKSSEGDPTVFVRDYANWEVKPQDNFSGETFEVIVGNGGLRSKVLKEDATDAERHYYRDAGCRIIEVPSEYSEDFGRDLESAIRDIAGIATHAISAFIHRLEKIEDAVTRYDHVQGHQAIGHPCTQEEYTMQTDFDFMWGRLCSKGKRRLKGGHEEFIWRPKNSPGKARYIHIDTSLSGDSTGLVMGYVDRHIEVVRRNESGEEYSDVAPFIVIDLLLRVNPPEGDQIFLPDVRRMVYELQEHGFHIAGMSCDSYQSAEMIQQMKRRGVKADVLSVDRTTDPYDALKSAMYEDRIAFYEYGPLISELKTLEYDSIKRKVDHPVAGSKDVADALAGVVYGLMQMRQTAPIMMTQTRRTVDDVRWIMDDNKIPWKSGRAVPVRSDNDANSPLPIIIG